MIFMSFQLSLLSLVLHIIIIIIILGSQAVPGIILHPKYGSSRHSTWWEVTPATFKMTV